MWKKEYHKLYFNETNEGRDITGASILKYENFPKSLFKYTKAKYCIKSLEDNYIKLTTPIEANDPFEGDLFFDYELLSKEYKEDLIFKLIDEPRFNLTINDKENIINSKNPLETLIRKLYENGFVTIEGITYEEFENRFLKNYADFERYSVKNFNAELKKQIMFVSLSEDNDITPLWSHYADNHKGVCIEYNLCYSEDSFLDEACHPIFYVNHANYTEEINQLQNEKRNKLKILEEPFLKKSNDWSYEKEWRVLINKRQLNATIELLKLPKIIDKRDDMCFIKFPKPTSVFLGLKISSENEKKIKEMCSGQDINVFKMVKDESNYNLSYIEL